MAMYSIGSLYKIELRKEPVIYYTGEVKEEDAYSIKLITTRNEVLIIGKELIAQAKQISNHGGIQHEK